MIDPQIIAAAVAARPGFAGTIIVDIVPLADTGLAHWHARIGTTGALLRAPKQSQMRLGAEENLAYQAACFRAAEPSGHTPKLIDIVPPYEDLPLGALLVEAIDGRPPRLPGEMPAIAEALAALHQCPISGAAENLFRPDDPLAAMWAEVETQAAFLDHAGLDQKARAAIDAERAHVRECLRRPPQSPPVLISFDAHPGNFLVTETGRAVLVDLEKARVSLASFDLAHATLYTSTTWDPAVNVVLDADQIAAFYGDWARALGPPAADQTPTLTLTRRLMWLWSVTWCAKWRVESRKSAIDHARAGENAEDWSTEKSEKTLIDHVAARVDDYLSPDTIDFVRATLDLG
ncbi:MAG: aminoglycoside phosphotransferase family protein [Hyphomicrobiales bacterium]|nr:aminoglycoside phosphotransferase family protein [Hyphomicrobiales bacterium]